MISGLRSVLKATTRSTVRDADSWISRWLKGTDEGWGLTSASGEVVTWASSLGLSAYFAAIRNIAEDIAKLPKKVYEDTNDGEKEERREHPVRALVHTAPNPEMTAMSFWETMLFHACGRLGAFAEIERKGGMPIALWPIDPGRVTMKRSDMTGAIVYWIRQDNGQDVPITSDNMFHIHGIGTDGITGLIVSNIGRETIGAALGAQKHAGAFFGNSASPEGFITVPAKMQEAAYARLRDNFESRHKGAKNHYGTLILDNGAEWKPIMLDPEKSQLDITRKFGIEEVCRLFRMPPNKVQHLERSTYNNIAEENKAYAVDTLHPWAARIEQEAKRKLFSVRESSIFMEIDFDALLRADVAARWTAHREARYAGAITGNEIRRKENMNSGGPELDVYWAPNNMMDARVLAKQAEDILAGVVPSTEEPPPGDDEPIDEVENDAPEESDSTREMFTSVTHAHKGLLRSALERSHRLECDKVARAAKRESLSDFLDWRSEFYAKHRDYLRAPITEVVTSYMRCIRAVWPGWAGWGDGRGEASDCSEEIIARYIIEAMELTAAPIAVDAVEQLGKRRIDWFADQAIAELLHEIEAAYCAEHNGELIDVS